jgi:hypothetical protein
MQKEEERVEQLEWETPSFAAIKEKRSKRISPYSETELWERDEILSIVKYEPYLRNKAALTLFWDLDARNHENESKIHKHNVYDTTKSCISQC